MKPLFLFLIGFLVSCLPLNAADRPVRVLIVDGFSNHDWRQTTTLISNILVRAGAFNISVSTATTNPAGLVPDSWHPKFADYDVVIQNYNDINHGPAWPEPVKQDFEGYVRNGGGAYIFHSAQNAFVGWNEYEQMVGLLWRPADYGASIGVNEDGSLKRIPAGEGDRTNHGPRTNTMVMRLGEDSIHAGMPRQWLSPDMEVYFYARGPAEGVNVLAYARDSKPELGWLWPVEWTVAYGKGRVYVSTYGHVWRDATNPPSMRCAAVQTILPRAVQWLAGRPVTIPVPADFPGTNKVSVRAVETTVVK